MSSLPASAMSGLPAGYNNSSHDPWYVTCSQTPGTFFTANASGSNIYMHSGSSSSNSASCTRDNLLKKAEGVWDLNDDLLFEPHTKFVLDCINRGMPFLPILSWNSEIKQALKDCESALQKSNPTARIHKGAIYYNIGYCYLESGDIDSAFQMFAAAGTEDQESGRRKWADVLIGNHPLSEKIIINKVVYWIGNHSHWSDRYQQVTGNRLDQAELKKLVEWLAGKHEDAIQLLHALHRFIHSEQMPDNLAKAHIQVRTLADIILVVESSLRRWQTGISGQLHVRMERLLSAFPAAASAFSEASTRFCNKFPKKPPHKDRESVIAVNWVIEDHLNNYLLASSNASRAGLVAYLTVRLRNSLMHVIDESLQMYQNKETLSDVMGHMIAAVGLSMAGDRGTIAENLSC